MKANTTATAPEPPNLRLRRALMRQITAIIERRQWTQAQAAGHCGVSQPRINDLLRGRVARFSLDALVNVAARLRAKVSIVVEPRK